ncbi:TMhelix containing protein [Vibrio phage 1.097.O._10N.286.49.B3]|uniref:TMhelix containing protein n=1 Tax=Vibrio phage 1.097.O._10N.286.49.B3 TaxID=1881383 RepID=A0A2I7R0J2_9CAUD|nr:TMhelix containing protein [Vibrio phage 1.097.O._10N.286.49.B3]AUR87163.1 TMhelix containing protein [Vibrio phage 1.097.O._10N.286.49.B3]
MTLSDWLKTNIISLVLVIGSFIGAYVTIQSNIHTLNTEFIELQAHVRKLDNEVSKIPLMEKEVENLKEDLGEFKPIIADLARGVHGLNVTLARLEGKLETSDIKY